MNARQIEHLHRELMKAAKDGVPCQADPDLFFFEDELPTLMRPGVQKREAKALCATCPAILECLEYAIAADEPYGYWAGLSRKERVAMKKDR